MHSDLMGRECQFNGPFQWDVKGILMGHDHQQDGRMMRYHIWIYLDLSLGMPWLWWSPCSDWQWIHHMWRCWPFGELLELSSVDEICQWKIITIIIIISSHHICLSIFIANIKSNYILIKALDMLWWLNFKWVYDISP